MRYPGISQYSVEKIGISTYNAGIPANPDGDVLVTITRLTGSGGDPTVLGTDLVATEDAIGLFAYILSSVWTAIKGDYQAEWSYVMDTEAREFVTTWQVVNPQPYWDSLSTGEKQLVENIYFRIEDTFDSVAGGPYLWEVAQTSFGFETIARLLVTDALPYINMTRNPTFEYVPSAIVVQGSGKEFPVQWYGLWEKAGYWSLLKHIARSYLEMPAYSGLSSQAAYVDRSGYQAKWRTEADAEKAELDEMLKWLKRKFLGATHRAGLIAGGYFPTAYGNPARPRWPYIPHF